MNILCWLWPLLAGLICGLLGYLLGKSLVKEWREKYNQLQADLDACKKERIGLESELKVAKASSNTNASASVSNSLSANASADVDSWKQRVASLEANLKATHDTKARLEDDLNKCLSARVKLESDLKTASLGATSLIAFNADAAKEAFGKKIKQDDLKIVEGIGPKIEGLFHDYGIKTWKALGEASLEKCQEVLNSGGDRYRIHNPKTWPKQAQLAYEGKWEELIKWQDELDGGKA